MDERKKIAKTEAIILHNDSYYFVPIDLNYLFEMSKDLLSLKALAHIDENETDNLYSDIVSYGDYLFLIPKLAEKICVYCVPDGKIRYIELLTDDYVNRGWSKFLCAETVGEFLFLIPFSYPYLVKINMKTLDRSFERISDSIVICDGTSALVGDEIWITDRDMMNTIAYNVLDGHIRLIFKDNKYKYNYLLNCREYILFFSNDSDVPLIKYSIPDSSFDYIDLKLERHFDYWKAKVIQGCIYLMTTDDLIIRIDRNVNVEILNRNDCVQYEPELMPWERYLRQCHLFERNGRIYSVNGFTSEWYYYDGKKWNNELLPRLTQCENCLKLEYSILPLFN